MLHSRGWRIGSINERKHKDGTFASLAQIVIKRDGKIVHRDNRTFDRGPAGSGLAGEARNGTGQAEGRPKRNPHKAV
ncbi:hypothetical protein GCM10010836_07770 [Aminobacter aminovorans]